MICNLQKTWRLGDVGKFVRPKGRRLRRNVILLRNSITLSVNGAIIAIPALKISLDFSQSFPISTTTTGFLDPCLNIDPAIIDPIVDATFDDIDVGNSFCH